MSAPSRALVAFVAALVGAACAAPRGAPAATAADTHARASIRVHDAAGSERFAGAPAYSWRRDERVATLPGYGELRLGDAGGGDRCRLVEGGVGATPVVVYERAPCGLIAGRDGRVCLAGAAFTGPDDVRVVDGCVDEGDLVWRKVDAPGAASIAPVEYHRVCAPVPAAAACPITYLRLDGLTVESNPDPMRGAALAFDDGAWRVCWLEAHRGAARATYTVRTACDASDRQAVLAR